MHTVHSARIAEEDGLVAFTIRRIIGVRDRRPELSCPCALLMFQVFPDARRLLLLPLEASRAPSTVLISEHTPWTGACGSIRRTIANRGWVG